MKTMNDGFTPAFNYPIEVLLEDFKDVCRQIDFLESEKNRIASEYIAEKSKKKPNRETRNSHYGRLAAFRLRISELTQKKDLIKMELSKRMERSPVTFSDDTPSPNNECVGYCYGKCIYVDNEGDLRFREIEKEGAEEVGEHTETVDGLGYVYELPAAEMKMILDYLVENPKTPLWVRGYEVKQNEKG